MTVPRTIYCPFCEREHEIRVVQRRSQTIVENTPVEYEEEVYVCPVNKDSFVTKELLGKNLLSTRDSYRKLIGRLLSGEIKQIRNKYDLTQKELSNLLGWGDVTIQRYEKKLVQDETYDQKMRLINDDPYFALDELERHKDRFSEQRYFEIKSRIKTIIKESGVYYLKKRVILSEYSDFMEPSIQNGNTNLDLEKIDHVIRFLAKYTKHLYTMKLMELLWYTDVLSYKKYERAISGLVYMRFSLGVLPLAYQDLLSFMCDSCISIDNELLENNIVYRVIGTKDPDLRVFAPHEIAVLQEIVEKFVDKSERDLVQNIVQEDAYALSENDQVIPFSLASSVKAV
ncbi:MAG: type II TA system antitoxin MqsA family protein [Tumebacillaceae bacterium]